ncbi:hypothetical protein DYB32_001732 [Aphanomyces invadans]|uniref:Dynein heavy chain coiled coil stalk domain-containing protein n=1 Tax=Aphanomyces invadans TaxID=157072 RepID=A0A418B5R9_9STRA|nr:hypothetical protein DYB32_001732 [Aphanomyces invadans]
MRQSTTFTYAFRILETSTKDQEPSTHDAVSTTEGSDDGQTIGAGDKLLQVLRRWQVCNAVVVVNRLDRSLTGGLIGAQTYKLIVESAKLALEQFALDSLQPSEAAKLALQDVSSNQNGAGVVPHLTVQEMTYAGAPTNMVNGTVQRSKQGRINHFQGAQEGENNDRAMSNRPKSLERLGISKDDLAALKVVRMPPKELHLVLVCVGVLLHVPDLSWLGCQDMLNSSSFCANVLRVRATNITKKQATRVRVILQEPQFTPELIRRVSVVGASLLAWVLQIMDAYDSMRLGFDIRGPEVGNNDDQDLETSRDDIVKQPPSTDETTSFFLGSAPPPEPPPPVPRPGHTKVAAPTATIPTDLFVPKAEPTIQDCGRMLRKQTSALK